MKTFQINSHAIIKATVDKISDEIEITLIFTQEKQPLLSRIFQAKLMNCEIPFVFDSTQLSFHIKFFKSDESEENVNYIRSLLTDYMDQKKLIAFIGALEELHDSETLASSHRSHLGYQQLENGTPPSTRFSCPNPLKFLFNFPK